jgi:DNA methylase
LPDDVARLTAIIKDLEQKNRLERADKARVLVELDLARDELRELAFNRTDEQTKGIMGSFTGWLKRRRRPLPAPPPERPPEIEVRAGNCLDLIEKEPNCYDAIVTDAPYSIGLHGKEWDSTDVSFSPELWNRFFHVLKPGGYVAFFTAPRLYHRAAMAAEAAGFTVLPFLAWRFREGLPKPINCSELFDRDNLGEREVIGVRRGSGFTQANVDQGAQNRTHTMFAAHARYISDEAQNWRGYYYGRNALKPCLEPILLVQKPIATGRMIDNIRQWGTGALNIGALQDQYGFWPSTILTHRKTNKTEHQTEHPSVKPITLMEDLCTLVCPRGGRILDAFGGTGTTGIAAKRRGYDCVLIEQDAAMCAVMEDRIRRET